MEYLLKSAAIVTLFYVCYKLFLEKETYFVHNRFYFISGLVLAFIVPFIVIPIYVIKEPLNFDFILSTQVSEETIEQPSFDFFKLGIYIYLIGVSILIFKSIIEAASLQTILKSCIKHKENNFIILKTSKTISPFSFFNLIVYNPKMFNNNELKHVIDHEKVHAKQWHSLDVMLSQITCIILWFNPIVWLYKKEMQQNLEFIADETAQGQSECSKTYQHLLLKTSVPNKQLVLANYFYNSLIKKRIVMLHKNPSNKRKLWKLLAILPLLAAFMFAFNTRVIAQNKEKEKIVEKVDEKVIAFSISKDSEDQELDNIKSKLKEHGVTVSFKKVKRNSENEITSISISASGKKSNANYSVDNESPISTILISYNENEDTISIGNAKKLHFASGKNMVFTSKDSDNVVIEIDNESSEDGTYYFTTSDGKEKTVKKNVKVIELKDDDDGVIKIKEGDGDVYIVKKDIEADGDNENEKEIKVIVTSKNKDKLKWVDEDEEEIQVLSPGKNKVFISGTDSDPLIFIDDKESTKAGMDKLDPDKIDKVEVYKGEEAINIYGEKAKDGVIKIYTKKQ